jgi:hypothetical protein
MRNPMNLARMFVPPALTSLCLAFFAPSLVAADAPRADSRVVVVFEHSENFLDVRDSAVPTVAGRDRILASLRDYIVRSAPAFLPPGDSLRLVFANIKLAGVFAVGELPPGGRLVSAGTPPLFLFGCVVTDPSGKVVRKSSEKLEPEYFMGLFRNADPGDPLRYDKAVLDDWMRNGLGS